MQCSCVKPLAVAFAAMETFHLDCCGATKRGRVISQRPRILRMSPVCRFLKPFPSALQGIGLIISRRRTSMNAQCKCLKSCRASLPCIVCFQMIREQVGTCDSREFWFGGVWMEKRSCGLVRKADGAKKKK